jgi:hypothetical protein
VSENADLVLLEYLARVADTAHANMTSDERMKFVTRLRSEIDEARAGSASPTKVRAILDGFGDPDAVVEQELRRLDRARSRSAPPPRVGVTAFGAPAAFDEATVIPADTGPVNTVDITAPMAAGPFGVGDVERTALRRLAHPGAGRGRSLPSRRQGGGRRPEGEPPLPPSPIANSRWPAALAVLACGLGGLLLPPLWLVGAAIALWSHAWIRSDQIAGLGLPVLVAVAAGFLSARYSPGTSVWHDLDHMGLLVFRYSALAGAAFLGWRLLTGAQRVE